MKLFFVFENKTLNFATSSFLIIVFHGCPAGELCYRTFRSVGGIRASLYNAMTVEETDILREYMEEFQKTQSIE